MPAINRKIDWSKYNFSGLSKRDRYKKKQQIKAQLIKEDPSIAPLAGTTKISRRRAAHLGVTSEDRRLDPKDLKQLTKEKGPTPGESARESRQRQLKEQVEAENAALGFTQQGPQQFGEQQAQPTGFESQEDREAYFASLRGGVEDRPVINLATGMREQDDGEPRAWYDLARIREQDTFWGKVVRVATDWRTTIALLGTLATVGIGGLLGGGAAAARTGAAAAGSRATISATVSAHRLVRTGQGAEKLLGAGVRTATRNFIGKPAASGVGKLFAGASRFATNAKSQAATTSLLTKLGMSVGATALIGTTVGTIPFARFELAEATDKIGIAIFKATEAGDFRTANELQIYLKEMLDDGFWGTVLDYIPFANVWDSVGKNLAAAQRSAAAFEAITDKKRREILGIEESPFARERRIADEAALERKKTFAEAEAERYKKIEEERKGTREEQIREDEKRYAKIEEETKAKKLKQMQFEAEYFRLIREKKYDEAQALLDKQ